MTALAPGERLSFRGYRRPDGSVGIRNHLLVVPSVVCANTVAQRVAALIPGAIAVPHPHGCAQVGDDVLLTERVLAGAAANPNVGAALVIGLGCETCQSSDVAELARRLAPHKPVESLSIQGSGGSIKAIARGVEVGKQLMSHMAAQQREVVPLGALTLATQCSSPDATSSRVANPAVGAVADVVVGAGGRVLLGETPELVSAGGALTARAAGEEVAGSLRALATTAGRGAAVPIDPALAAGAVSKGGTTPVQSVLPFAESPATPGLHVMDTPAHDVVSVTAMAVAGAQLCCFTTGAGSPVGNALIPVIKLTANRATFEAMADNIDYALADDEREPPSRPAGELLSLLLEVCSGRLTSAELIGHQEFAVHRIGPTV